jgi:hypothetical protein
VLSSSLPADVFAEVADLLLVAVWARLPERLRFDGEPPPVFLPFAVDFVFMVTHKHLKHKECVSTRKPIVKFKKMMSNFLRRHKFNQKDTVIPS